MGKETLVHKNTEIDSRRVVDFYPGFTLEDIPDPDRCHCGSPIQKEFLEYEVGTPSILICTSQMPGYGCIRCGVKAYDPVVYTKVLGIAAQEASQAGEQVLANHLNEELVLHQEVLANRGTPSV